MALPEELPPGYGLSDDYSATSEYHARSFASEFILGQDKRARPARPHPGHECTQEAWQPIKFTTGLDEVTWLH